MTHLPILPVLLPLMAAVVLLLMDRRGVAGQRPVSLLAIFANLLVAAAMLDRAASGAIDVYALGSWQPPFGIVLVADRLSAMMVMITAVIAIPALLFMSAGDDADGAHFHPLYQLQIAGLNGAFLTGDAFNLFVFFEVMLIASYGLLVHGAGAERVRGGLHYVVINLVGSTLFLFALGLVYGTLGTLNMADIAGRLALVPEGDQAIVQVALTLLIVVFALKGAIAPLFLWLPRAYPSAPFAVAALFAVMTKVGIYAILRFDVSVFAGNAVAESITDGWLFPLGIVSIAIGIFGMFSAGRLSEILAHLVLVSSGTLAAGIAIGGVSMLSAVVFYLPHTVIATAALFLVIGLIARQRGDIRDVLERAAPVPATGAMAVGFFVAGLALSGLPPLSGFVGKWMLLKGSAPSLEMYVLWAALILSGFAAALVLARSGSRIFWEPLSDTAAVEPAPRSREYAAMVGAIALVLAVSLLAAPLDQYARATAAQLEQSALYRSAVIPSPADVDREVRP